MAFDWIKMRVDLYRDPKVCVIADLLLDRGSELARYVNQNLQCDMTVTRNVMRNVTVGALVSVWGVLRHRGKRNGDDLVVNNCTVFVIDDLADIPGFGSAMVSVGWVVELENSIVLPRFFEEFNVDPAEESKKKNAERQRKYREKLKAESNANSNVTVASQSNYREEKRREDISTSANADEAKPNGFPHCPIDQIISLYHETLPTNPQMRVRTPARDKQIRARWQQFYAEGDFKDLEGGVECFRWFFGRVRGSRFLTGQTDKPFRADLEWLTKASNFAKIIDGRYDDGAR